MNRYAAALLLVLLVAGQVACGRLIKRRFLWST